MTVCFGSSGKKHIIALSDSLPATYRPDLLHFPITNGELYNGDAIQVDEVLPKGVPPPGIGGVGESVQSADSEYVVSTAAAATTVLTVKGTVNDITASSATGSVDTRPTVLLAQDRYAKFVFSPMATLRWRAQLADDVVRCQVGGRTEADFSVQRGCSCRNAVWWGKFHSRWDSVKPNTGEYTINYSQCPEDVCAFAC